ncbi:MAG: MFS transporter [Proteobacteria bacterium]|nr:MFS transporter [Pseudomonadota bacterium]MBU1388186.1 MFS transporter [Pseudomonadota bacterium]MBU1542998.1 MFS transporter [Pseudomonadota bacterium]MBU2480485.1 MFS transporter [Pseudomonadota bacterium]
MIPEKSADRKTLFGWVMFDFANSAYTTLVVTFIYGTYFVKAIASDEIAGTALWSRGVTITALSVALLSPFLGAIADKTNLRKRFLLISTIVTVAGTVFLYFVKPGQVMLALWGFVISNIAFELTNVFYNAFLPEIASKDKIGRLSGIGWGVGYIGGLAAMVIAMVGFVSPETPWFGFTREAGANIRATNLLVGAWFAVFAIPLFAFVRQPFNHCKDSIGQITRQGFSDIITTVREIKKYKQIATLLLARMIYNDGLVTIFAFGGIYAAGTFGFSFNEIMIFGICINIAAGIGALIMGFFDDRLGGKKTIQISNIALGFATFLAAVSPGKTGFWIACILIGLFAGPNQSASRSLLGRFVPKENETQFFGFFAFSGKLTAFMGPLLLGVLTQVFNSQRAGVAAVILFFVFGALVLSRVDEKAGIALSDQSRASL